MIVFLDNPQLIPYIADKTRQPIRVMNFSSLYSGFEDATCMCTSMNLVETGGMPINQFINTVDFDIMYASVLLQNDRMFETFTKFIASSYFGFTVILLVYREPYRDAIMESVIKFIQQRYGYNCWIVNSIDDIDCLAESTFTPAGIITLDSDVKRYDNLYQCGRVSELIDPVSMINVET